VKTGMFKLILQDLVLQKTNVKEQLIFCMIMMNRVLYHDNENLFNTFTSKTLIGHKEWRIPKLGSRGAWVKLMAQCDINNCGPTRVGLASNPWLTTEVACVIN
jgi:hypothetical protein